MRAPEHVHVVVVAFNSAGTIRACLSGISASLPLSVVVVDNSADPATMAVCDEFPGVTWMASDNVGFARASRVGVDHAPPASALVLLNPDVALTRPLDDVVRCLSDQRPLVAGALRSGPLDVSNVKRRVTPGRELLRALLGARRAYSLPRVPERLERVPQLDGAFMAMSGQTWRALDGLDEQFELYYEDVDLCRRAEQLGGCWLLPVEYGTHIGGISSESEGTASYRAMRLSRQRFLSKHFGARGVAVAMLVTVIEWVTRSLSRQSEGQRARDAAVADSLHELRRPGQRSVLPSHSVPSC